MTGEQLAAKWKEWIQSDEGRKAANPETLGTTLSARNYLENRLWHAFTAGAKAAEGDDQ
jgi:hypothetical protein